jgi:hypothetical protein
MKTIEYLYRLPEQMTQAGEVIVHNHVRHAGRRLGSRGFRAWIAAPDDDPRPGIGHSYRVLRCDCDWAPHLGPHYRVDRDLARLGREAT